MPQHRRNLVIGGVTIVLVALFAFVTVWWLAFSPLNFSSEAWISGDVIVRGRMIDDLRRRSWRGLSRGVVESALGPPNYKVDNEFHYLFERPAVIFDWTEILVVKLSEDEKVLDVYVTD